MSVASASAHRHRVQTVRNLGSGTFVLRFDRHGLEFSPGQYISVGLPDEIHRREYSVYSSMNESAFLEILVKEVAAGHVSKVLRRLRPGDELVVEGPFGFFTLDERYRENRYVFVATGTGISPFHCMAHSFPELRYQIVHGVRTVAERYEVEVYPRERYLSCVSREWGGDYRGRVTDFWRESEPDPDSRYYVCGNCDMIYELFDILQAAGVPHDHLFAEVYF